MPEAVGRRDLPPAAVIDQEQSMTMVRHAGQSRRFAAIHLLRVVGLQSLVGRADRPLQQGQDGGDFGAWGIAPDDFILYGRRNPDFLRQCVQQRKSANFRQQDQRAGVRNNQQFTPKRGHARAGRASD